MNVKDSAAGKRFECPNCGTEGRVPDPNKKPVRRRREEEVVEDYEDDEDSYPRRSSARKSRGKKKANLNWLKPVVMSVIGLAVVGGVVMLGIKLVPAAINKAKEAAAKREEAERGTIEQIGSLEFELPQPFIPGRTEDLTVPGVTTFKGREWETNRNLAAKDYAFLLALTREWMPNANPKDAKDQRRLNATTSEECLKVLSQDTPTGGDRITFSPIEVFESNGATIARRTYVQSSGSGSDINGVRILYRNGNEETSIQAYTVCSKSSKTYKQIEAMYRSVRKAKTSTTPATGTNANAALVGGKFEFRDPRQVLPIGAIDVKVMNVAATPRIVELATKFQAAAKRDPQWFLAHSNAAGPGQPMSYDPRLGLTQAEFEEFRAWSDNPKLAVVAKAQLGIDRKSPDLFVVTGLGLIADIRDLEVDLATNTVRNSFCEMKRSNDLKPSDKAAFGRANGACWSYEDEKMSCKLTLGILEESGRGLLIYELKGRQPTENSDRILIYDLPTIAPLP